MMQQQIWGGVRQSAQPCLYLNVSNALLVPIPPLAEQHCIVAKVDELMALCDALTARLADAAQTQRHLADAVTEHAAA
jgi:type I restriction enzyme S subunit